MGCATRSYSWARVGPGKPRTSQGADGLCRRPGFGDELRRASEHRTTPTGSLTPCSGTQSRDPRECGTTQLRSPFDARPRAVRGTGRSAELDDEQERRTTLLVPDRTGSLGRGGATRGSLLPPRTSGGGFGGRRVAWKKPRSTTGGMVAAACAGAALPHRELAAHRVRRAGRADDGAWDAAQVEGTK
jgi:hypothetical protein